MREGGKIIVDTANACVRVTDMSNATIEINGRLSLVSSLAAGDARSAAATFSEVTSPRAMVGAITDGRRSDGWVTDLSAFCAAYHARWGTVPSLRWGVLSF